MKKCYLLLIVCLLFGGLGGCATGPTAEELANADYGALITQDEAHQKAEQWIRGVLKDPESARFEWREFDQGWVSNGLLHGGGYLFGYMLIGDVNARNAFGGYVGRREYQIVFHDGEIVAVWGEHPYTNGGMTTYYMRRLK